MSTGKRTIKVVCAVPNCSNRTEYSTGKSDEKAGPELEFFPFPYKKHRAKEWAVAIGRPDLKISSRHRVCSEHFTEEDFNPEISIPGLFCVKRQMKRRVIPTLKIPKDSELNSSDQHPVNSASLATNSCPQILLRPLEEPCLLCSRVGLEPPTSKFQFHGATGLHILNDQLWTTFVLREVLNISMWKFSRLLKTLGPNAHPGKWFVTCKSCSDRINEIAEIQTKIKQLQDNVMKLKATVNADFKASFKVKVEECDSPLFESTRLVVRKLLNNQDSELRLDMQTLEDDLGTSFHHGPNEAEILRNRMELSDDETSDSGADQNDPLDDGDGDWFPMKGTKTKSRTNNLPVTTVGSRLKSNGKRRRQQFNGEKYPCNICSKVFLLRTRLLKHKSFHIKTKQVLDGRLDCFLCHCPFDKIETLRSHFRRAHRLQLHETFDGISPQRDFVYSSETRKEFLERLRQSKTKKETSAGDDENGSGDANSGQLVCALCPNKYIYRWSYEKHLETHERSKTLFDGKFDCSICNVPFLRVPGLARHLRRKHNLILKSDWDPSNPQKDHIREANRSSKLTKRAGDDVDADAKYLCSKCPAKFQTDVTLKTHEDIHDNVGEDFHCPQCNYPHLNKAALDDHVKSEHESFLCTTCGFDAKNSKNLRAHMYNHKIYDGSVDPSISTTDFVCNVCKQTFPTRKKLVIHKVNSHADELGIEVWKCDECPRKFSRKDAWRHHKLKVHGSGSACAFSCDQCGHAAPTRRKLNEHMEKHGPKKVCEYCSASYCFTTALRRHIRMNHPEKVHEEPKKNFFQNVNVTLLEKEDKNDPFKTVHIVAKSKVTEHLCKFCDARFPQKSAMSDHIKNSHSDKLYQCDLCENKYMSVASLQLHKKINHNSDGQGKVKCGWCYKAFSHRFLLYDHRRCCRVRPEGPNVPLIFALPDTTGDELPTSNKSESNTVE